MRRVFGYLKKLWKEIGHEMWFYVKPCRRPQSSVHWKPGVEYKWEFPECMVSNDTGMTRWCICHSHPGTCRTGAGCEEEPALPLSVFAELFYIFLFHTPWKLLRPSIYWHNLTERDGHCVSAKAYNLYLENKPELQRGLRPRFQLCCLHLSEPFSTSVTERRPDENLI